jgi:hypothetical protein
MANFVASIRTNEEEPLEIGNGARVVRADVARMCTDESQQ